MMNTKLGHFEINFDNSQEFHQLKREVFGSHSYYFETDNKSPRIIDAGAHIGISTLYFKQIYPMATVVAIEPLSENYRLLQENVFINNLQNVQMVNCALDASEMEIDFYQDNTDHRWFSTASRYPGAWTGTQTSKPTKVPTKSLEEFLDKPVDFLKMDIEGAEQEVLEAAKEKLEKIQQLAVEFHPVASQNLNDLVNLLTSSGFQIKLEKRGKTIVSDEAAGLILIRGKR